ncbi:DNA topoisomerase 1 like protein [Verticillium longisporum]|uniref:DNA topoisomerase 1 like protein n=1 Tax=Verticillium longisporum TaxID=100787 RepID=A0A8I3AU91_VERLO|nr:DNA topoisomerase 1 like protein [Verticillium longisporum]
MATSSDDDMPLARSNGHVSSSKISRAEDKAMDATDSKIKPAPAGISVRNGPVVDDMDISPAQDGLTKRKARTSITKINYQDGSDSDDDKPLAKRQKTKTKTKQESDSDDDVPIMRKRAKMPPSYKETALPESDSDDDQPLSVKLAAKKASIEADAAKEARAIRAQESKAKKPAAKKPIKDDSDDEPLAKPRRQSNGVGAAKKRVVKDESDSDSDKPIAKKAKKAAPAKTPAKGTKAKAATPAKKGRPAKKEESEEAEEDEAVDEWWNEPKKEDDSVKWTTLEHNGVLMDYKYEPLPKNVKLVYDGKPLNLPLQVEEAAWFFGSMFHSKNNVDNPTFQKNFFEDFREVIKEHGPATDKDGKKVDIKDFPKINWQPMADYAEQQSAMRKNRTKEEKKKIKEEKDAREEPFKYCLWDGRKEKMGNFRVEPPSLFRGRGDHPKTGRIKKQVFPEQITINIGKDAKIPKPPDGHKWKAVVHDNKATWLASWQENINGAYKYVMTGSSSRQFPLSDHMKFEKARELKKHIDRIRRDYGKDLKSETMADRQRATAMYLIDKFALRAGNEKNAEEEAETVGCCSLKFEHVTLKEPNTVVFDFLGKDSIRFFDEFTVERQVFKNLKIFKKPPKGEGDDIFDRLTTTQLNKHLKSYMDGLTAKVFRTYNASFTMSRLLQELPVEKATIAEKVKLYNDCNRKVAILCNHKRTVGAGHQAQMEKLGDRIKGLKYQQWRTKMMILDVDPKQKKKLGVDFFKLDEELDNEWIEEHLNFLYEEQRTKITKKFEKDNEKLVAEGSKKLPEKELKERLKAASELLAKLKKEHKTKKVEAEGRSPTVEKLLEGAKKIEERAKNLELQAQDRDGNKEVALGTSKLNYIDPRLTVVFSRKFDVPIEKFFSKTMREKFNWAIQSVDDDTWEF